MKGCGDTLTNLLPLLQYSQCAEMMKYLVFASFIIALKAQATCKTGGGGPCINNACMDATLTCAKSGTDDVCCAAGDLNPPAGPATTNAPTNCVDQLNPRTGVSDCTKQKAYCDNAAYYKLMTEQCPKTCGRCTGTVTVPTTTCVDKLNPSTGVSDCPSRSNLCSNAAYYNLMTEQCPKTCGRCGNNGGGGSTTCVDKLNPSTGVSDCPSRSNLCNNSAYYSLMTQECPRTCGRCTSG